MALTQCRRCGGQISTNSTSCPWCGHATAFNLVGPLLLLILLGTGISLGLGLIRWQWLEQSLGLDRGFMQEVVVTEDDAVQSGGNRQGDLTWRTSPSPSATRSRRGGGQSAAAPEPSVTVSPRVAVVVQAAPSSAPALTGLACADATAIQRLISRYPGWSDTDLGLIACGRIRSGFSGDQVRASLGVPERVERDGSTRQKWHYAGVTVLVEQGRVLSFGR